MHGLGSLETLPGDLDGGDIIKNIIRFRLETFHSDLNVRYDIQDVTRLAYHGLEDGGEVHQMTVTQT